LVGELHSGLLGGHLVGREDLLQDGQLVRTRPLALLLVVVVLEGVGESAWELAVELEEYHSEQHDLTFVLAIIIVEVQLNDLSSIDSIAARQFTS
jgi:hypothetical protein